MKVFGDAEKDVTLLPMMVGQVREEQLAEVGQALKPFFLDDRTLFVISSDFCHWGESFDYQRIEDGFKVPGEIYKSIEALDKQGMAHIEKHNLAAFQ